MVDKEFQMRGRVIDKATQRGIGGLHVEAWDQNLICDDFLDQANTDAQGAFSLSFSTSSFSKPDPGDLFDAVFAASLAIGQVNNEYNLRR
jgi:hypothetical protein